MRTVSGLSDAGMDSFLDVFSNVVGVMILITVVVVVNSGNMSVKLGLPVVAEAPVGKTRQLFECRDGRIHHVDLEAYSARIKRAIDEEVARRGGDRISVRDAERLFDGRDVGDENYSVHAQFLPEQATLVELRPTAEGDPLRRGREPADSFAERIADLDPDTHWIQMIVRPDGFDVFRRARSLARGRGFDVGWEPDSDEEIYFSSSGSRGGTINR